MIRKNKIAVLGGGGRTGGYIVNQLLNLGYHLKLLIRNPESLQLKNSSIDIIEGDALDVNAIRSVLEDCHAVISSIGQRQGEPLVASQATINVLNAMQAFGIQRYILVAGINIDTPYDKKGSTTITATEWMKKNFPIIQTDRQNAYTILENSPVNWTMVRVPLIEFTDAQGETVVSLEDCIGSKISAGAIATFVSAQLDDDCFWRKSPFIAEV
jgi:putative NADH-flavin reductase